MKIINAQRADVLLIENDKGIKGMRLVPGKWYIEINGNFIKCTDYETGIADQAYSEFLEKNIGQVA